MILCNMILCNMTLCNNILCYMIEHYNMLTNYILYNISCTKHMFCTAKSTVRDLVQIMVSIH